MTMVGIKLAQNSQHDLQLREDILISAGTNDHAEGLNWVIHDPLQNRYFQINEQTKDLITLIQKGLKPEELILAAERQLKISLNPGQIDALYQFFADNQLLVQEQANWRTYAEQATQRAPNSPTRLLQSFLFLKIPLFRPDNFLRALLPYMAWLFSPAFYLIALGSGLIGIFLLIGQWTNFSHDLQGFISLEGLLYFGLSLVFVKSIHELAHALTAARNGCNIPTMGIAFFFFAPLLYTDVSDAWRMTSRKQRLWISAAGIISELVIACFATLFWIFLPDGTIRDMMLILASISWMMSIFVNLNPLIKFDGYYLLADFLRVDNLQQRAFEFGRWRFRQILFAPTLSPPEQFSANAQKGLVAFAWMTWAYRLILFSTIAIMVYQFTFKLLGIALLAIAFWFLVLRPVINELKQWKNIDQQAISPHRIKVVFGTIGAIMLTLFIPWSTQIQVPAQIEAAKRTTLYPSRYGQIIEINAKRGDYVEQGAPIATLQNFEIENRIRLLNIELGMLQLQLENSITSGLNQEDVLVLKQQIKAKASQKSGLEKKQQEMTLRAPFSGIVRELNRDAHIGRWIGKSEFIAVLASEQDLKLKGYLPQSEIHRINAGSTGKFIPRDLTQSSIKMKLSSIASAATPSIELAALASVNGGNILVEPDDRNKLIPTQAQVLVEASPSQIIRSNGQIMLGTLNLNGSAQSFAARIWNQISKVAIREMGF